MSDRRPWNALLRSFGPLAVGEVAARMLSFLAIVVLARELDPAGFGLVALGVTLVTWFALVVDSGTEVLATREIARQPARVREIVEPVLGLRLALAVLASILLAGTAALVVREPADRNVLLLFALVLPALALNLRWMVLGVGGAKSIAGGIVTGQLLFLVGVLLLVSDVDNTVRVPAIQASAELLYAAVVIGALSRRIGIVRPRVNFAFWRATLRSSSPLFVYGFARASSYSLDVVLIAFLLERTDVGLYSAAYKPVLFLFGAIGLFSVSFLAAYSASSSNETAALLRRAALFVTAAAIAIAIVVSVFAGRLVEGVYGSDYASASRVLVILIWAFPLMALAGLYGSVLLAADKRAVLMRNAVIVACFGAVANLIAIPLAGIEGAAAVVVASNLVLLLLSWHNAISLGAATPVFRRRRDAPLIVAPAEAPFGGGTL